MADIAIKYSKRSYSSALLNTNKSMSVYTNLKRWFCKVYLLQTKLISTSVDFGSDTNQLVLPVKHGLD